MLLAIVFRLFLKPANLIVHVATTISLQHYHYLQCIIHGDPTVTLDY